MCYRELEAEAQAKLQRAALGADTGGRIGRHEVVQNIHELEGQGGADALRSFEVLEDGGVEVPESEAAERANTGLNIFCNPCTIYNEFRRPILGEDTNSGGAVPARGSGQVNNLIPGLLIPLVAGQAFACASSPRRAHRAFQDGGRYWACAFAAAFAVLITAVVRRVEHPWLFALRVGLVTGVVTAVGTTVNPYIEYYADNLPERRLGVFGYGWCSAVLRSNRCNIGWRCWMSASREPPCPRVTILSDAVSYSSPTPFESLRIDAQPGTRNPPEPGAVRLAAVCVSGRGHQARNQLHAG